MGKIKVFLDTDVIISSLLSQKGASFEILNSEKIDKLISKSIRSEAEIVTIRKNLNETVLAKMLKNTKTIPTNISKEKLIKSFSQYVLDIEDSHVVSGAKKSKAKFLLTHNKRHYHARRIKNELDIEVLKPGEFLQYLRSS